MRVRRRHQNSEMPNGLMSLKLNLADDRVLTRSRKVLVRPLLPLLSRIIDSAPLKWLVRTVEDPLRTI